MLSAFVSACKTIATIASPRGLHLRRFWPVVFGAALLLPPSIQAAEPTRLSLTISSSSAAFPTVVTLSASATVDSVPVTSGLIEFCDTSAPDCEDAPVVGMAQLNSSGTASIKFVPSIGSHDYLATFRGLGSNAAGSQSNHQTLTVTGLYSTTTTVAATGNPNGYGLTATVVGFASQPPVLAGNVTFTDTTKNNVLGVVPLGPPVFAQSYVATPPVPTGNSPAVAGLGDFNEDGEPDLAVVNAGDNTISILLGHEDGTFGAPLPVPAFGTPTCENTTSQSNCSIVVADFNADGHEDLAVTSGNDDTVTVLKGNGQGAFTPFSGSPIAVGQYPEVVRTGDFNRDGIPDLAVANSNDNTISILLGNGDGAFTPANGSPFSVGIGSFPFFIAVGDFNHDNIDDLAITNGRDNSLSILEGQGDGTFVPFAGSPIIFPNASGICPVVAGDFNGDGITDLAIANFDSSTVYIVLSNGDGTFTVPAQSPIHVGLNPFSMTTLDYNGDGHLDLAVASFSHGQPNGSVSILLGDGAGDFSPTAQSPIAVGSEPDDVVTADFNGDGRPDLAIPDSGDTVTTILLNTVTQTATASLQNVVLPGAGPHVVEASYPANASFAASSGTVTLQGLSIPTALTLTDNPTAQLSTLAVTFTAQLSPSAAEAPTGTVSFFDQSVSIALGSVPISATGQAAFTTSSLGPGVHVITATFSGDVIFQPITSNQLSITISELRVTRLGTNNTTILPGTTVAYTLQIEPQVANAFLYNVNLSASGLPAGATATFSPALLPAGEKLANVTMTVETSKTALNEMPPSSPPSPYDRLPLALGLLLPLFVTPATRRCMRRIPTFLELLLLAALSVGAVAGLSGCSGAGLFAARKVSYSITVTANEGGLLRSTEVPLAIQ